MREGFTLIELLVVVTIIVVLLALLTPALDRALYQAELALDGTNLKSLGAGVTTYATEHHRAYPERHIARAIPTVEINDPWFDNRKVLSRYMALKALADPMSEEVDLSPEASRADALVFSGYAIYAGGWFDNPAGGTFAGMRRLGDRWTYYDDLEERLETFTVLAGCRDARADVYAWTQASHPDDEGRLSVVAYQNAENPWEFQSFLGIGAAQHRVTFSWWQGDVERGTIDTHSVFNDGSVNRYDRVVRVQDERMADVPEYFNSQEYAGTTGRRLQVPPR